MATLKHHLEGMKQGDTLLLPSKDAKEADSLKNRVYYFGKNYPRQDGLRYSVVTDANYHFVKVTLKEDTK
jgi:hypothetical protein